MFQDASIKNPNYHRTSDRVSTIDFSFCTKVVKGAVATLATLAVPDTVTSGVTALTRDLPLRVLSNPSYGNVEFLVSPDLGYEGRIVIHNVAGRVINSVRPVQENGVVKGYWNGRDSQGMQVSPGIYLISAEGLKSSAKVVLLR